jgi:benzylsuccinate CoA-transferase BbsF subunit
VFTYQEWQAFCHVIGDPTLTKEQRFASLDVRKENEDELERLLGEWTRRHSAEEVMHMMQAAGVQAGVVENAQDLLERDPQLKGSGFIVPMEHSVLGVFDHVRPPFELLRTRARVRTAPCLGEHTEYVCTQLLGMTDEEFVSLFQDGVLE